MRMHKSGGKSRSHNRKGSKLRSKTSASATAAAAAAVSVLDRVDSLCTAAHENAVHTYPELVRDREFDAKKTPRGVHIHLKRWLESSVYLREMLQETAGKNQYEKLVEFFFGPHGVEAAWGSDLEDMWLARKALFADGETDVNASRHAQRFTVIFRLNNGFKGNLHEADDAFLLFCVMWLAILSGDRMFTAMVDNRNGYFDRGVSSNHVGFAFGPLLLQIFARLNEWRQSSKRTDPLFRFLNDLMGGKIHPTLFANYHCVQMQEEQILDGLKREGLCAVP